MRPCIYALCVFGAVNLTLNFCVEVFMHHIYIFIHSFKLAELLKKTAKRQSWCLRFFVLFFLSSIWHWFLTSVTPVRRWRWWVSQRLLTSDIVWRLFCVAQHAGSPSTHAWTVNSKAMSSPWFFNLFCDSTWSVASVCVHRCLWDTKTNSKNNEKHE